MTRDTDGIHQYMQNDIYVEVKCTRRYEVLCQAPMVEQIMLMTRNSNEAINFE